jgi:hypothetical protein
MSNKLSLISLLNTFTKNTKTNIAPQRYISCLKTLCVNKDSSHLLTYLNNRGEAHVKTRNGKWDGIKKNGAFIDRFGCIDLLDAITHVGI